MNYKDYIQVVEDFPKEGISFKDITPLLADYSAFSSSIDELALALKGMKIDAVVGPEARGFIIGTALAERLHCGFIMARKKGKLPGKTYAVNYELEYGLDTLELPLISLKKGMNVVLADDLLATGGTLKALIKGLNGLGINVLKAVTLIELTDLNGAQSLGVPFYSLIKYPH